jgi:y4mF family transcriptional regulator
MKKSMQPLQAFLKEKRQKLRMTQQQLAGKSGVGLRFIRDMEQGKASLRMDKVNQVLLMFGYELGPVPLDRNRLIDEDS